MSNITYAMYKYLLIEDVNILNESFKSCVMKGHNTDVECIGYLDKFINQKEENLQELLNWGLHYACSFDNTELVKIFLTSSHWKQYAEINSNEGKALERACSGGCLDTVQYLLTDPGVKEHANLHLRDDIAFKTAFNINRMDIVEYLILEHKIKKTESIEKLIKENIQVRNLFSFNELKTTLSINKPNKDKLKI